MIAFNRELNPVYDEARACSFDITDADLDSVCRRPDCRRLLLGPHDYVCAGGHRQRVGRPPKGLVGRERAACGLVGAC